MSEASRIHIQIQSLYVSTQSVPEENRYVFSYTVTIRNLGRDPVQLRSRYWLITNGNGRVTEIQGKGVLGEQPFITPGSEYQYTSGTILETPIGTMQGHYVMLDDLGDTFVVDIPVFRLAVPTHIH